MTPGSGRVPGGWRSHQLSRDGFRGDQELGCAVPSLRLLSHPCGCGEGWLDTSLESEELSRLKGCIWMSLVLR